MDKLISFHEKEVLAYNVHSTKLILSHACKYFQRKLNNSKIPRSLKLPLRSIIFKLMDE